MCKKLYRFQIKKDTKKYGVSLSTLKSLQDFQRSLLKKKRKIRKVPYCGECTFSINNEEPQRLVITSNPEIVSSESFGVIYLKNRVKSIIESDFQVTFEGKERTLLFKKIIIKFDKKEDKTHFMSSIENVLCSDLDFSGSLDSTDSVLAIVCEIRK